MSQTFPALGIDVGGGSAKIGIVSPDGELLAQRAVESDPHLTASALLDCYLAVGESLKQALGIQDLCGIGIGLPGHIDFDAGTTLLGNVPSLYGFPIVEYVRNKTGNNVFIENDATLAAIAEHCFGVGQGSNRFLTVTLGTGIGVGFVESGRPVHTSNGTLGDIGHVIVDPSGERTCRLGCHGCLESTASALALEERFLALRRVNAQESIDGAGQVLEDLFDAARAGDIECTRIVEGAARDIAAAVASWMHIFSPDRIAFAGGVSAAGEDFLRLIRNSVTRLAMPAYSSKATLLLARLGSKAGLVGAAALCFPNQRNERVQT
jgi:glucokinase